MELPYVAAEQSALPSKKWLGNRDANLIEARRHHFELFMQACIDAPELRNHEPLLGFIGVTADAVALRVMFDPASGTALVSGIKRRRIWPSMAAARSSAARRH